MYLRLILCIATALLGGCATSAPPPGAALPATPSTTWAGHSLKDPGLHRFITQNTGRDPGDAWDFEALNWVAFYFHPSLDVARAQWTGARDAIATAGLRPNPTLTLTPGYNFTPQPGLSPWLPAINLDFLFVSAEKRNLQVSIAQREADVARQEVFNAAWQVRVELRRALVEADAARRRAAQSRAQAAEQRALVTLLEQRFAAGAIAATELSTARIALFRAEATAAEAEGQISTARTRVAAALGLPVSALEGAILPAPPRAATFTPETLMAARTEALRSRPDILIALAKYQSAHAALQLELARRTPDFHLGPGYQWDQGLSKWTVAFAFELPVFSRNEPAIAAATARATSAAADFNLAQGQAIAAIDQASTAVQVAQGQLSRAQQLQAETQQQANRAAQRLEAGAADQFEVQAARLELSTVASNIIDAENALNVAAGQLEDALRMPLPPFEALTSVHDSTVQAHE